MTALLSPRVWLALALAAVLALTHSFAYRSGKANVRAAWDAEKVIQLSEQKEADRENRKIDSARTNGVIAAQNAAVVRNQVLQADAASAVAERKRLLDAIAAIPAPDMPSDAGNASNQSSLAGNQLFAACTAELQDLARVADNHASDVKTLRAAWPVK